MNSRNAAGAIVGSVENRSVAVGHLPGERQERRGNGFASAAAFAFGEQIDRFAAPASPVSEQAACDSQTHFTLGGWDRELSQQINDDVVVVAGVEGDFVGPT